MRKPERTKQSEVLTLMRRCRAYLIELLREKGHDDELVACAFTFSKPSVLEFMQYLDSGSLLINDIPRYMFKDKPVTPSTWTDLQNMQLDIYEITKNVAMLVDPVTREYCYVFWDETSQCSNPYETFNQAMDSFTAYFMQL